MRRLARAILELESYRTALSENPWQNMNVAALNAVIATLSHLQLTAPYALRHGSAAQQTRVDEMISQINAEVREDESESEAA